MPWAIVVTCISSAFHGAFSQAGTANDGCITTATRLTRSREGGYPCNEVTDVALFRY